MPSFMLPSGSSFFFLTDSFGVLKPDGSVVHDKTQITTDAERFSINIMGARDLDGGGLRVYYHEELFLDGDDGTIYAQDYAADGSASGTRVLVSEAGHLYPRLGNTTAIDTLPDGTLLYGADALNAPDPDGVFFTQVYPRSFLDRFFPFSAAVEEIEGGFAWATLDFADATSTARLHLFDTDLSPRAVKIEVGGLRFRPNEGTDTRNFAAIDVAGLAGGNVVVAFSARRFADDARTEGGDVQGIFFAIFDSAGVQQGDVITAYTGATGEVQEKPRVFALEGGGFALAFQNLQQASSAFDKNMFVRTYDSAGTLVDEDVYTRGIGDPLQYVSTEDLAIAPDGTAAWWSISEGNGLLDALDPPAFAEGVPTDPDGGTGGGTDGPDTTDITGTDAAEVLEGTDATETINAGGGSDWITPGGGSDTIDGG
ncbi:hypothetical protein ABMC89_18895, partial [Sulfitobacter sp. HNIBRBA3233]